jgi:hypothetical protein
MRRLASKPLLCCMPLAQKRCAVTPLQRNTALTLPLCLQQFIYASVFKTRPLIKRLLPLTTDGIMLPDGGVHGMRSGILLLRALGEAQ